MLKFASYRTRPESREPDLRGAYIVGIDDVPVRGDLRLDGTTIMCESRNQEALGISVLWPVEGQGVLQLQTTRLPTREQPYNLHIELVRQRLMQLQTKREEWGLFDYPGVEAISEKIDQARRLFIQGLQQSDEIKAARLADEALQLALTASGELCRFHAEVFLGRRRQASGFSREFLGVAIPPDVPPQAMVKGISKVFDFVRIPFAWRDIQKDEHKFDFSSVDTWVKAASKAGLGVRGGPVLNFGVQTVPDWMYVWENDYEAISGFAKEHVRRTVQRFADKIGTWVVASGLHADNVFSFNFEQIIDLTRMSASITRQAAPRSQIVIDLSQPWGEYFARNQRTAPPMLYAEMAVQSGISFDAFGLQFVFGLDSEGFHLRDMLQISSLVDRLANLGKPLHVTAVAVPSDAKAPGVTEQAWSEKLQADWYVDFCEVVLSKPYVESVCLQTLSDGECKGVPTGGVLAVDMAPKPVFKRLSKMRRGLSDGAT